MFSQTLNTTTSRSRYISQKASLINTEDNDAKASETDQYVNVSISSKQQSLNQNFDDDKEEEQEEAANNSNLNKLQQSEDINEYEADSQDEDEDEDDDDEDDSDYNEEEDILKNSDKEYLEAYQEYHEADDDDEEEDISDSDEEEEEFDEDYDNINDENVDYFDENEYIPEQATYSEINVMEQQITSSQLRQELDSALENIREIGRIHGQELIASFIDDFADVNNRQPTEEEVEDIFTQMKRTFVIDADTENDVSEEITQEAIEIIQEFASEAIEYESEMQEALEIVRELGEQHGEEIAHQVCDTFFEINNREPELQELESIFARLSNQFAEEAEDEQNDSSSDEDEDEDEVADDEDDNNNAEYLAEQFAEDCNISIDSSQISNEQVVEFARRVVKEALLDTENIEEFIQNIIS